MIEFVHTESACLTTSILGGVVVVRGCGLCAWCASHLLYLFLIIQPARIQPHPRTVVHTLKKMHRFESPTIVESLVIQLIRNTILCRYTKGTERAL